MNLGEKRGHVERTSLRLEKFLDTPFATEAATAMWRDRVGFYLDFYRRLDQQLAASAGLFEEPPASPGPERWENSLRLGLSGRF